MTQDLPSIPLRIELRGDIQSSNFDEWKRPFLEQIRSIQTDLQTDDDFAEAVELAKMLRKGEKTLAQAKAAALDQAAEIRALFAAIDEVSEEARQTRLQMERQIRERKKILKTAEVERGIERVRRFLDHRSENFRQIDPRDFLDPGNFHRAIKGKKGLAGVSRAVDDLVEDLESEMLHREREVERASTVLASLPVEHQVLFQDRGFLLALSEGKLREEIDRRLAVFRDQAASPGGLPAPEPPASSELTGTESYRITVDLTCPKSRAVELARAVREHLGDESAVIGIRLSKVSEEAS